MKTHLRPSNYVITKASLAVIVLGLTLMAVTANGQEVRLHKVANRSTPRVTAITGEIKIGQEVTFEVNHLSDWAVDHDPRKLVPYLNGRALKGLYPEQINLTENKLLFHLRRTPDSEQVWADLFHEPVLRRPVTVSAGLADQSPFDTVFDYDNRLSLTVIPTTSGLVSLIVILASVILFGYLVTVSDIIRDRGPRPEPGKNKRYNLERTQIAFWFLLVSIAYICLWLITGNFNSVTPAILGLIGISGATSLVAGLMRAAQKKSRVSYAPESEPALADWPRKELVSEGFFADILSDANGYAFHRFQMVAWTILLGIIFVSSAYHNLAMPEFSGGVLLVTGISAGIYLGFESLENGNRFPAALSGSQGAIK